MKLYTYCFLVILISSCSNHQFDNQLSLVNDTLNHQLNISYDHKLVTVLNYDTTEYKPSFFPVNVLSGERITRGWPYDPQLYEPTDHPHQKGMWFTFGDVNKTDFWNNSDSIKSEDKYKYGRILADSLKIDSLADKYAAFSLFNIWKSETNEKLLKENTSFELKVKNDFWILKRITRLTALKNIEFNDNKEGLFAIRMAREFQSDQNNSKGIFMQYLDTIINVKEINKAKTGKYFGSNGKEGKEVWGTENEWVHIEGIKNSDSISIVIMDHPDNVNHPPHWHARDYGLFSVNNFGRKSFCPELNPSSIKLQRNKSIQFIHCIILKNDGFFTRDEINILYQDFISD